MNAAYRVLSDPGRRAAYDASRFLRPVVTPVRTAPPRTVQREPRSNHLDPVVALVGVLLLIGVGACSILVLPRATSSSHTAGVDIPVRLQADVGLKSFPGTVLVAPSNLAPFKDLPILRVDATGQGIARYAVYYGDLTAGVASITGLVGRTSFDFSAPRLPDCAPAATYCAGPGPGQSTTDRPGVELFRPANLVDNYASFATHRVCCNGLAWSLNWYEPNTNMSYAIDLARNVAAEFGSPASEGDEPAARAVAALAAQLVRLP